MRHLIGFILALIAAVALFMGGGWGLARLAALSAHGGSLTATMGVLGLTALIGTGLLLGVLLVTPAISPLATGLPGLALLAWTALLAVSARWAVGWFPLAGWTPWLGMKAMLGDGVLAFFGTVMIVPLFLPGRWRRGAYDGAEDEEDDDLLPAPTGLLSCHVGVSARTAPPRWSPSAPPWPRPARSPR